MSDLHVTPAPDPERRARWKRVVEPRLAEVLHRLDILEDAFANRTRYRGGVVEADCDNALSAIRIKVDALEEAFRRGQRRPRFTLPD